MFRRPTGSRGRGTPSPTPCGPPEQAKLNPPGAKPVAPHDLRHSCAGLLFAAGVPVPKVAAILRHADARLTLTVYAGLVESQRGELLGDLEAALR